MRGSIRLFTFAGIGVKVHWTFWLLIPWVVYLTVRSGADALGVIRGVLFVFALFGCVVLHEFGHALTARRFGVNTRDITLLPIGGVARLERIPANPVQEFLIAIAGPAVNVVIAAVLLPVLLLTTGMPDQFAIERIGDQFLFSLVVTNIFLVVFNLIPAFPMDGGRILRALLATVVDHARATRIAARVGSVMAVLFVALGLINGNPFLILIALFVFLGGQAEAAATSTRAALTGIPVGRAMLTNFRVLHPDRTLADASDELLAGSQQDFPVIDDEQRVVGVLTRAVLLRAVSQYGLQVPIARVGVSPCPVLDVNDDLQNAIDLLRTECPAIPVTHEGRLVGLLTLENVSELLMLRGAMRQTGRPAPPGRDS